jgi:ADP-heptose:LPS heptosyltransferase
MSEISVLSLQKILLVRPDAIGDTILTLPAIKAIKDKYPHLHITVMASPYNIKILETASYIDEIILDKFKTGESKNFFDLIKYAKEIRSKNFDAVVHFYSETEEVWLTVFAGIKYQIGDKAKLGLWPIFRKHGVFLKTFDQTKHVVDYNFQLLQTLGIKSDLNTKLIMNVIEKDIAQAKEILLRNGWQLKAKLIGIHMGVGAGNKAISPVKFAEFVNILQEQGEYEFCITGYSAKEKKYRDEFIEHVKVPVIDLVGKTSLLELMAVFKHYDLYVGVDTGPFHLAASIGIPQLAIFPTRRVKPTRWAPWRNRHLIIRKSRKCPHFCPHEHCPISICSDEIMPMQMVEKAKSVLEGAGVETPEQQFAYWFKKSMQILILFNKKTKQAAFQYQKILASLGFDAIAKNIHDNNMKSLLIEKDITIIHNFSQKKKIRLLLTTLIVSLKLFNPPLIVNSPQYFNQENEILEFYKEMFEQKLL